jgi:hypothetical protein
LDQVNVADIIAISDKKTFSLNVLAHVGNAAGFFGMQSGVRSYYLPGRVVKLIEE